MSWSSTLLAAACIAAYPAISMGADSTLVLVIGGEAYDGPPKFQVTFDGVTLGEGTVAAAIDTASVGRFADVKDKTPYVQTFTFQIPEAQFNPTGTVGVTLINEASGAAGAERDRNLYLASISVNGRTVTSSGFTTVTQDGITPNSLLGEFLVLPDGSRQGITGAPQGGWPSPASAVAAVAPVAVLPVTPPVRVEHISADPLTTGSIGRELEPIEVASLDQNPETGGPSCNLDEIYNVVGFNENSNDLTPPLMRRLDQVLADIGPRKCKVLVTGYSSKQGSFATSALFAIERAQNTLRYLKEHGLAFLEASATGVGATDQFGPEDRSNRRVVIAVSP